MEDLTGRVAAVTGTASGIGKATAVLLAEEGCCCAISDIQEEGLRRTEGEIRSLGVPVQATILDVADREAVYAWADDVVREFGKANIIVNNAGVALSTSIKDMTYEDLEWLLNINLFGMIYGTKAFLPHLKRAEAGHIVNVSSVCGFIASPTQSAYTMAKFAIKGFTECLRLELEIENCGVSATVVHPGGVRTNIAREARISESLLEETGIAAEEMSRNFDRMAISTPEKAAAKIVEGIKKNKHRVLIGPDAYLFDILQRLCPTFYLKTISAYARLANRILEKKST
ncbi:MAG: SDR family NAD(P)-dependent oxidoreductase [Actinomycetota bacterium]|nr:SDR family NAD(P)-dependent oxidoreductase [Actinomycetota bacterium]